MLAARRHGYSSGSTSGRSSAGRRGGGTRRHAGAPRRPPGARRSGPRGSTSTLVLLPPACPGSRPQASTALACRWPRARPSPCSRARDPSSAGPARRGRRAVRSGDA